MRKSNHKTNRIRSGGALLLAALVLVACAVDESSSEEASRATAPGKLTACGGDYYDMALLTERLQSVDALSDELGLDTIESCDDAERFVAAYHRHVESAPSQVPVNDAVDAIEVDDAEDRILGGFNDDALPGMVQLASGCGGILINERAILTAAHCVDQDIAPDKNGWATKRISKFVNGAPVQVFNDQVRINIHPSFDGSASHDLAVIKLFAPDTFPGFAASDRTRIYIDFGSLLDLMWLYARGPNATDGSGSSVLRYMSFQPDWWGADYFLKDAGGQRICKGDSGGPVVSWTADGFQVVTGLIVNMSDISGQCATAGAKQRAVRLHQKVDWIEDMLDIACTQFNDDGLDYVRCFEP